MTTAAEWKGSADLEVRLVPVESLTLHPDNPREGNVDEIAASLKRFGQTRPVLVDPDGVVVAGNHTLLAALSLGWPSVAVVRNDFGSAEEARAYLLADNRLSDLGTFDQAELLLLVAELEASGRWEGTGYTPDDLDHMRALEAARDTVLPAAASDVPPADPTAPPGLREVVLLFDEEQQQAFGGHVRALRNRYGLEGVTDTVLRALHDEALLVHQGEPA